MNRQLATMWIALAFVLMCGITGKVLTADIDWAGETPAAWLQAAGGLAALAVSLHIALHERRVAHRAELRARKLEHEAAEAAIREFNNTVEAIVSVADEAIRMNDAVAAAIENDPTIVDWAWRILALTHRQVTGTADRIVLRTSDPHVMALTASLVITLQHDGKVNPFRDPESYLNHLAKMREALVNLRGMLETTKRPVPGCGDYHHAASA